tara:strand:+ start:606 stop:917 length:312 start_codon:yes stop_codon:yes gene_type:complete
MTHRIITQVCIIILCLLPAATAAQNIPCFPYKQFVERLRTERGEYPVAAGIDHRGTMVQVVASEAGNFTVFVMVQNDGKSMACPLLWGEGWQKIVKKPKGDPA